MNVLSLADVDRRWADVERALDDTAEVDRWCSGPDWVLPVHHGFSGEIGESSRTILIELGGPADSGFALLARYRLADRRTMIAGLEPLWGFASPLIGPDPGRLAGELATVLAAEPGWDVLVLPGMPTPIDSTSFTPSIVRGLAGLGEVRIGQGITRQVADLDSDYPAWLSRRSARFRRNLRRAAARAECEGISFIDASQQPEVFDRLLIIEGRTWKGAEGSGITSPEMSATYRAMVERLQRRGRLRLHIARRDEADVGYILGGVRAGRYRGLQLSYTEDAAALSVGHLLQDHQLQLLSESAEADHYDLGMDLEYKRRWADRAITTYSVVIERR